ncbi:MAG: BLUF domain-containing protein [Leptospirales bacterium]|nr:BLUF domain-containing protein [Leptospirales bacterium]
MKRLTYVSIFSRELSAQEVEAIGALSVRNNTRDGLTGALFCFKDIFYQILEGDDKKVDACYARILNDDRHTDIFCLKVEMDIRSRFYGDWAMKTVLLDSAQEELLIPLRNMLDSLARTHFILGKYAPEQILRTIQEGLNPLDQPSFHTSRVVLFSDIMGSTTLTESLRAEVLADMLSAYYEIANRCIARAGGTISKLTGDGLMAYFPIEKAQAAVEASLDLLGELGEYRKRQRSGDPRELLYAGVGISAGPVLEGSIGSDVRKDYTLLGDAVNSAARLESTTRKVGRTLVFDSRLRDLLPRNRAVKRLGLYQPKGKLERLEIFTIPEEATNIGLTQAELKEKMSRFKSGIGG